MVFSVLFVSCEKKSTRYLRNEKYFDDIMLNIIEIKLQKGAKKAYLALDSIKQHDPAVNPLFVFKYYRFMSGEYFSLGKTDSSIMFAQKLLPILNEIGSPEELPAYYSLAYYTLSDIYYNQNNFLEAFKYLYMGKQVSGADHVALSEYNYRIGMILYRQGEYLLAARSFKDAAETYQKDSTFERIYRHQEVLANTGLGYGRAHQPDSAYIWFQKAINYIDAMAVSTNRPALFLGAKGVVLGNWGQVYAQEGELEKAIPLLKQSIAINDTSAVLADDAFSQKIKLARIYIQKQQLNLAKPLMRDIEKYKTAHPSLGAEIDWYSLLSAFAELEGDLTLSLASLKKAQTLKDAYLEQKKPLTYTNIVQQLRIIENRNNMLFLQRNNQQKNLYLFLTVVLVLLTLIILALIYFNWRKSKKAVANLNVLNRRIQLQAQELIAGNAEKDRLMRVVAHDLRNPIGSVLSLSRLLQSETGLSNNDRELLILIERSANDALLLIKEILESHQKRQNIKQPVNLRQLVEESTMVQRFSVDEKQQYLTTNLPKGEIEVYANREHLQRVLANLISNASKFSPEKSTIYVDLTSKAGKALICVKDEGIGISHNGRQPSIEELAFQNKSGTKGEQSFGMGLAICKKIIEDHKGRIWYQSSVNGTSFYVEIPLADHAV